MYDYDYDIGSYTGTVPMYDYDTIYRSRSVQYILKFQVCIHETNRWIRSKTN